MAAVDEVDGDPDLPCRAGEGAATVNDGPSMWCVIALYGAEDAFDAGALLEGTGKHSFVVSEPTRCLADAATVSRCRSDHHPHRPPTTRRFPSRLAALQEDTGNNQREVATMFTASPGFRAWHPPVFVSAETSIHEDRGWR